MLGVVAQLVERLFRIQEAWGSIPHYSIFFNSRLTKGKLRKIGAFACKPNNRELVNRGIYLYVVDD